MWEHEWEGSLGENRSMYMYGWVPLLSSWNYIVNQLYSNTKQKLKQKKNRWLWIFPSTEVRSFRTGIKTSPHREKNNASSQLSTIRDSLHWLKHFSSGSAVKNPPAVQEAQETQVWSLGQEGPLEKGVAAHSSILAWSIHSMDRGGWRATVYRVAKSRTWQKWLSMHAYMHWL